MWDAKREKFLHDVNWLNTARVAFSTGTSGNSSIPNYDHLALVGGGANYNDNMGIYPMQSGNENLGWEKLWTTNIAFHLGFINHRINVDLELYNKRTSDMLMSVPVSYADKGEGFRWDNIGEMVNRGAELHDCTRLFHRFLQNVFLSPSIWFPHIRILPWKFQGFETYCNCSCYL